MTFRTLLVEDHPTMRATLCEFISAIAGINLAGTAPSAEEALRMCNQDAFRLALIDVSLPGMSGIDLVAEFQSLYPDLACLMLSGHQEICYVQRALANGARGYVLKGDPTELLEAIGQVTGGQIYLSDSIRNKLAALEA